MPVNKELLDILKKEKGYEGNIIKNVEEKVYEIYKVKQPGESSTIPHTERVIGLYNYLTKSNQYVKQNFLTDKVLLHKINLNTRNKALTLDILYRYREFLGNKALEEDKIDLSQITITKKLLVILKKEGSGDVQANLLNDVAKLVYEKHHILQPGESSTMPNSVRRDQFIQYMIYGKFFIDSKCSISKLGFNLTNKLYITKVVLNNPDSPEYNLIRQNTNYKKSFYRLKVNNSLINLILNNSNDNSNE